MASITNAVRTWDIASGFFVLRQKSLDPFTREMRHASIGMPIEEARKMARRIIDQTGGDELRRENSELKTAILQMEVKS